MKRIFAWFLVIAMLVSVFCACGNTASRDTESATDTVTETATDTNTETDTETATETDSTTETESVTETESETEPPFDPYAISWKNLAADEKAELMRLINESVPEAKETLYGYGCPEDEDTYETILPLLMDAGITGLVTGYHYGRGLGAVGALAEYCEEYGMDLVIETHTPAVETDEEAQSMGKVAVRMLETLLASFDCIRGVYLRDEPTQVVFPTLVTMAHMIHEAFPDSDLLVFVNHFPQGIAPFEPGHAAEFGGIEGRGWLVEMDEFIADSGVDVFSFDRYPWYTANESGQNSPHYWVANVLSSRTLTEKYDIPLWAFLQIDSGEGDATATQFLLNENLGIACGVDTFLVFTACEVASYDGMILQDGTPTYRYPRVQAATEIVNGMKCVYETFSHEAVILENLGTYEYAINDLGGDSFLADTYGHLTDVESAGGILIGCGKDADGREGYYVVNTSYAEDGDSTSVTLTFDGEHPIQLWDETGLADIAEVSSCTLTLEPGYAAFIILK